MDFCCHRTVKTKSITSDEQTRKDSLFLERLKIYHDKKFVGLSNDVLLGSFTKDIGSQPIPITTTTLGIVYIYIIISYAIYQIYIYRYNQKTMIFTTFLISLVVLLDTLSSIYAFTSSSSSKFVRNEIVRPYPSSSSLSMAIERTYIMVCTIFFIFVSALYLFYFLPNNIDSSFISLLVLYPAYIGRLNLMVSNVV
jgi:hypothetical protein